MLITPLRHSLQPALAQMQLSQAGNLLTAAAKLWLHHRRMNPEVNLCPALSHRLLQMSQASSQMKQGELRLCTSIFLELQKETLRPSASCCSLGSLQWSHPAPHTQTLPGCLPGTHHGLALHTAKSTLISEDTASSLCFSHVLQVQFWLSLQQV